MQSPTNDTKITQFEQPDHWACPVNDYGILAVNGKDSQTFLQGQTTCDFKQLTADSWALGALCSPKGRVISTFKAVTTDAGFLLIVPALMMETVCNRLKLYILRSDVTLIDDSEHWGLIGFSVDSNRLDPIALPSESNVSKVGFNYFLGCHSIEGQPPRYLMLAQTDYVDNAFQQLISLGLTSTDSETWPQHEIANGIPTITPPIAEAFTPQMLNLDILNAISFEKGCYTGQEIVARTQHLGTLKRRMVELTCAADVSLEPGTRIFSGFSQTQAQTQDSVGQIVRSVSGRSSPSIEDDQSETVMLAVLQKSAIDSTDLFIETPEIAPEKTVVTITKFFDSQDQPQ
jgi:folate-binding protein YgfZ